MLLYEARLIEKVGAKRQINVNLSKHRQNCPLHGNPESETESDRSKDNGVLKFLWKNALALPHVHSAYFARLSK